ncbi:MAG: hypothetical protein IKG85_08890 [Clostridia bacterium]|nr:hypothetical protein [Clostridia bacterium]
MNTFFSTQMLLTCSGATLAVTLITQLLKGIRAVDRLPTRIVSYAAALLIMALAWVSSGSPDWRELLLLPVNAVVVALAANGSYDAMRA